MNNSTDQALLIAAKAQTPLDQRRFDQQQPALMPATAGRRLPRRPLGPLTAAMSAGMPADPHGTPGGRPSRRLAGSPADAKLTGRLEPPGRRRAGILTAAVLAGLMLVAGAACSDDDGNAAETAGQSDAEASEAADDADSGAAAGDGAESTGGDDSAGSAEGDADGAIDEADETSEADRPSRVVSISPTATETLWAIGAGDQVVAVDSFSYYPEGTPVTDIEGWNPNIEVIAGYEPDLVVMQTSAEVEASLKALGIEVLAQPAAASLEDAYAQISEIGAAVGRQDEAAALAQQMRSQIDDLVALAPEGSGLSYYHELDNTLYSVTGSTFIGEVYALFGLRNVADPADEDGASFGYPQLSEEFIFDSDPDLIFLADTICCGQDAETVAARPGWDQLSAVRNGNVVELDDDVVSRWGPRLVDFVADIAMAIDALAGTGGAA